MSHLHQKGITMRRIFAAFIVGFLVCLGLSVVGTAANATTTTTCDTESTGWVTTAPHGDKWKLVDTRTVTDEDAYDEIIVVSEAVPGQHYSYTGGPIEGTPADPTVDPDSWQANTALEPHTQGAATPAQHPDGTPYVDGDSGLHYTSNGNSGLADWFYYQAPVDEVTKIVHHDAVTHEEYKYERELCETTHTPPPPKCTEDQPCWDCTTMGNKDCGPDHEQPPADQPPQADKPELPHTGAGSTALLGLIGSMLIGAGGLLYRKFA